MDEFTALLLFRGVVIGSVYALLSLGFNVIYNTTGVLNFAQGEFVMVGAIATARAIEIYQMPFVPAICMGVLTAAVVGVLVDILAIGPARKAGAITHIIITIGAAIAIQSVVSLVWGTDPYHLPAWKSGSFQVFGLEVDAHSLIIIATTVTCMAALALFYRYSAVGRAMKACAQSPDSARLCGVSPARMSTTAFALSAVLGGIGGILVTPMMSMSFHDGTMLSLKGFAAAILGGMGNPVGGAIGGLLIGVLEQYSASLSSIYKETLALVFVVIVLLLRPKGLLGR